MTDQASATERPPSELSDEELSGELKSIVDEALLISLERDEHALSDRVMAIWLDHARAVVRHARHHAVTERDGTAEDDAVVVQLTAEHEEIDQLAAQLAEVSATPELDERVEALSGRHQALIAEQYRRAMGDGEPVTLLKVVIGADISDPFLRDFLGR